MVVAGSETASSVDAATDCAESDVEERRHERRMSMFMCSPLDDVVREENWAKEGGGIADEGLATNAPAGDRHNNIAIGLRE